MLDTYQQVLPKSPIGKALAYSIKRWDKLGAYAHNAILLPDNNKIENSIRLVALGRKSYLFAGSHEAARRSCYTALLAPANSITLSHMPG